MFNYHRLLDKLHSWQRKHMSSRSMLPSLLFVTFLLGVLCHNVWLSLAPETASNSIKEKRKLQATIASQTQELASKNLALQVEQEANKTLQDMFSAQMAKQKSLEKELSFYRGLMAQNIEVEGITINDVELLKRSLDKHFQLKITLVQQQKNRQNLNAYADITLIGVSNGKQTSMPLQKLTNQKLSAEFKYFTVFNSDFVIPDDFVFEKIQIKVSVNAKRAVNGGKIDQTFNVEALLNPKKEQPVILEQNSQVKDNS